MKNVILKKGYQYSQSGKICKTESDIPLSDNNYKCWYHPENGQIFFPEPFIRANPDYFNWEEDEREGLSIYYVSMSQKELTDFSKYADMKRFVNQLADWCDAKYEKERDTVLTYFPTKNSIKSYTSEGYVEFCLKFNSQDSAKLFIYELSKPVNKKYFDLLAEYYKERRLV